MNQNWGLRSKLWLECDGKPVMGDGRMEMLRAIQRNGSMKTAAHETGISYRRMRGAVHEMECTLGYPLVNIQRGGDGGGSARLTPAAHRLMALFEKLSTGYQRIADQRFQKLWDFFLEANGNIRHSTTDGAIENETI